MVRGTNRAVHGPFGGFVIETEKMPDGRDIHYYHWPDDDAADPPDAAESASSATGGPPGGGAEP